jgi:hypothetical protein
MEEGRGILPGAVDENRGPHLTSVRLIPRSERCTVYRFRPGPPAGPPLVFPFVRRFLTVGTCLRAAIEKFRPHPSHLGSALAIGRAG